MSNLSRLSLKLHPVPKRLTIENFLDPRTRIYCMEERKRKCCQIFKPLIEK
jgi:hypothetical protein